MISLLLKDMDFEQDIRELFMAFFPGERYNYSEDVKTDLVFRAQGDAKCITASLQAFAQDVGCFESPVYENRVDTKNALKRALYRMLSNHTDSDLPWGTLTGIRPTKIAMALLESGYSVSKMLEQMKKEYLLSDAKARLCVQTACTEKNILEKIDYENGWSLYVGIPFCPTRCAYCSFTGYPIQVWEKQKKVGCYIDALCMEIKAIGDLMKTKTLQTIYMGGGTPTAISAVQLARVLQCIKENLNLSNLLEFTVEAGRPDSITREKLEVLRRFGITRISINPQTMKQSTLDLIGRHHSVKEVLDAYALAREVGFENINMDIIMGLPDENLSDVRHTMEELGALKPESITVHSLAIKRAARLNTQKEEFSNISIQNTWEVLDFVARACYDLELRPYYLYRQKNMAGNFENVGYSKAGKECLYNILIMEEKQTILACGAGTSSKIIFKEEKRLERVETVKDPKLYIERIEEMIQRKTDKVLEAYYTTNPA